MDTATKKYIPTRPQYPNHSIYALHCGDLVFRYVGESGNVRQRMNEHRSRARRGHAAPVYAWMREVGPETVEAVVLAPVYPAGDAEALEATWIRRLLALDFDLLNEDGRNGTPRSKSVRGLQNLRRHNSRPGNARACVYEGVEYPSVLDASRGTGIAYSTLRKRLADV